MFVSNKNSSSHQLVFVYAQILVLSVMCFLLLLSHGKMPEKVDVLFPNGVEDIWLFSDGDVDVDVDGDVKGDVSVGGSHAWWIDRSEHSFKCHVTHSIAWPYCGIEIQLTADYQGLDLSDYKLFKVYVDYDGPSTQIGITLRTLEPTSFIENNLDSLKSSVVPIGTFELEGPDTPILIEPKEWQVLHWWLDRYNISRENRYTNFSNVVLIGLNLSENPKDGEHKMQLKKIEMIKNTIPEKTWFMFVISLWLVLIFLLVSWHLIRVLKQSKLHSKKAEALSIYAGELAQISKLHKEESMRDELTGLNNRKGMAEYLKQILNNNESIDLSLILFDLDFFKKINDTYGHDVGDQVLINVSLIVKNSIRKSDCFCRWGGEEFAILCPSMPLEKTREFANHLCDLISALDIKTSSGNINVSASFGVSSGLVNKINLLDELFEQADTALYTAKDNGRNRVE